jgi:hypothetical protein
MVDRTPATGHLGATLRAEDLAEAPSAYRQRLHARATWAALCAEVARLKVSILDGKLLELATSERRYRNRWSNLWAL